MQDILEKNMDKIKKINKRKKVSQFVNKNSKINAKKYFLLYLKPIINGTGNCYIESRTRELRRTDIIVDYNNEQYIIEMKIWNGSEYNRCVEKQLAGYFDDYNKNKGYMISFNFTRNKQVGVSEIVVEDKVIVEAVV